MKMKKWILIVLLSASLVPGGILYAEKSSAGINLNITIPLPGPVIGPPPGMAVIPGTYVYFAPNIGVDLFFYRGYWYRPYQGQWYFSGEYNGPWGRVAMNSVPPPLVNLPPDYRNLPPGYERLPYPAVRRNWRQWEEERYWDYGPRHEHSMHHRDHMGMGR